MPHLLQYHREGQVRQQFGQPRSQARPVRVATPLQGFLQGIDVDRQRVGPHRLHGAAGLFCAVAQQELCPAQIADQQDVGGQFAHLEGDSGVGALQHHALRTQHQANAQLLRGLCQMGVDAPGPLGPAGHRADQDRGLQSVAQKRGGQIYLAQVALRQGAVGPRHRLQPGGHARVLACGQQAGVHMAQFARRDFGICRGGHAPSLAPVGSGWRTNSRTAFRTPPPYGNPMHS
ncbi:hypothetical protein DEMA109039_17755 [Deinococcus marmoris]